MSATHRRRPIHRPSAAPTPSPGERRGASSAFVARARRTRLPAWLAAAGLLLGGMAAPGPGAGAGVAAQEAAPSPEIGPHIAEPEVTLDGVADEAVWDEARVFRLEHQLEPDEGEPPTEETEVRLFHDGTSLYVAVEAHHRDPDDIVSRTFERNRFHRTDQDGVALLLDSNRDDETAYGFIVTPDGARTDLAVTDGSRVSWNADWDAFWDASAHRHAGGWSAEMRIPFSSLRYDSSADGAVEMEMILWRYLAVNDEFSTYPAIPNDWGNAAYKPNQARAIRFENVAAERPLYLQPYVRGGYERLRVPSDDGETRLDTRRTNEVTAGVDLQYNVTSNLVLDVTYNTDFAQVEADDERVNLDRFSLFFPEKRRFFQERSDLFTFRFPGGAHRLFHSRRIGIHDGQPVPIEGGVRLAGEVGEWDLGVMSMQTGSARVREAEVPSENFGVFRVRRSAGPLGSYVGGMLTTRTDLDGSYNVNYGVDADLLLGRSVFITLQGVHGLVEGASRGETAAGAVRLQRRVGRGFSFGSSFAHFGRAFSPGVGYVPRPATNRAGHRTQYRWFPSTDNPVQNHSLAHRFEFMWDHDFGRLETFTTSLTWSFAFRNNASAELRAERVRDEVETPFPVSGITVPAGVHRFTEGALTLGTPTGRSIELEGGLEGGGYFGGRRIGGDLSATWHPSPHLSLSADHIYNRLEVADAGADVWIHRLRAGSSITGTLTASAFMQYNSSEGLLTSNARLRYNPREGTDLYVVYDEGMNVGRSPTTPPDLRLPTSRARSIQLKYSHTLQW